MPPGYNCACSRGGARRHFTYFWGPQLPLCTVCKSPPTGCTKSHPHSALHIPPDNVPATPNFDSPRKTSSARFPRIHPDADPPERRRHLPHPQGKPGEHLVRTRAWRSSGASPGLADPGSTRAAGSRSRQPAAAASHTEGLSLKLRGPWCRCPHTVDVSVLEPPWLPFPVITSPSSSRQAHELCVSSFHPGLFHHHLQCDRPALSL